MTTDNTPLEERLTEDERALCPECKCPLDEHRIVCDGCGGYVKCERLSSIVPDSTIARLREERDEMSFDAEIALPETSEQRDRAEAREKALREVIQSYHDDYHGRSGDPFSRPSPIALSECRDPRCRALLSSSPASEPTKVWCDIHESAHVWQSPACDLALEREHRGAPASEGETPR